MIIVIVGQKRIVLAVCLLFVLAILLWNLYIQNKFYLVSV